MGFVVASKDRVEKGRELGIVQANHGKASPMRRIKPKDLIVFYSPKLQYHSKQPYNKFTAIACVKEAEVYQRSMGEGLVPYCRDIEFLPCKDADIEPIIPRLDFIRKKDDWGFIFRFGFFEILQEDFETIANGMQGESSINTSQNT